MRAPRILSPADRERRRALRRMKAVAAGALVLMALLFAVSFALQERVPALAYLRAAAEGGMVGALADWFAVTALFRHPLGVPIPHTAIIPRRKDEIGRSLGEFVETNFLSGEVVGGRLSAIPLSQRAGEWLQDPRHAERVAAEAARAGTAVLRALGDDEVSDLIASLARRHLVEPEWSATLGTWLVRAVEANAHHGAVDLAVDSIANWLGNNPAAFQGLISRRLPSWVPSLATRLVDEAAYHEALKFVRAVQAEPEHPARLAIDGYLARLADRLQQDPATMSALEQAKQRAFADPRIAELAASVWGTAKEGLLVALDDDASPLRTRIRQAVQDLGARLATDPALQQRADRWIVDTASGLVERYRHDIASIITDTVERWDAAETTEKIELMVGRDLQYIRLNGTIVGALAGAAIFAIAEGILHAVG